MMRSFFLGILVTVVSIATVPSTTNILLYDLRPSSKYLPNAAYEYAHLLGTLSGLANRDTPRLFTIYSDSDLRWQSYMNLINWSEDANYTVVESVVDLVNRLSDVINGVALYDPKVPATSNLASTASGVYNLMSICYRPIPNTLYSQLVTGGPQLKINIIFVNMFTGNITTSAKGDAYLWTAEHFLDTKLADATYLGYYIDTF